MEQRLIDANELIQEQCRTNHNGYPPYRYVTVEDIVKKAITIDAVPVVRCGECKHHMPIDYCRLHDCLGWYDDKFCSYGERRTE